MTTIYGHLYAPEDRGFCRVEVSGGAVTSIVPADPGEVPAAAGASRPAPDGATAGLVLGGPSARILPGLLDIQINGAFGEDFGDPRTDVDAICSKLPRFGVTGFVPTIVTSPPDAYTPALANLRRRRRPGSAELLGVHVEGPFISPKRPGTHDPARLRLPDVDEAAAWLAAGDVAYVTLAPELPGALPLIEFLVGAGCRASIGHTDATWDEASAAADAGATLATHCFNAMRPLSHRDPGVAGYVLATRLRAGFICDGNHVAFEMLRVATRAKGPGELMLVTDALAGLGMPPGRYELAGREYVSDGTCGRLDDGTLTGSLLPLNLALRNLVEEVGVEPAEAVAMATRNPARALGIDDRCGLVAVGRAADLAVLDERWEVEATLIGGEPAAIGDERSIPAAPGVEA